MTMTREDSKVLGYRAESYRWLMEEYELEAEEAAIIEWQYGFCGGFHRALWRAITLADEANLERLSIPFPTEVKAYRRYSRIPGWWEAVNRRYQHARKRALRRKGEGK